MRSGLPLDIDILRAAYEYLRLTLPFKRWKLPHADEVSFKIISSHDHGWHRRENGRHIIAVSSKRIGRTEGLMALLAHEMVHMYCDRKGVKAAHGSEFQRCATLACRYHGFDPFQF